MEEGRRDGESDRLGNFFWRTASVFLGGAGVLDDVGRREERDRREEERKSD